MINENDFGNAELNKIYNDLDPKTKKEIDDLSKLEFKIGILNDISNKEIQYIYDHLKPNDKIRLESLKIRDRYFTLKQLLKKQMQSRPQQNWSDDT